MFPQHAAFICKKCLSPFYFSENAFDEIAEANKIICPSCHESGLPDDRQWVRNFFTFYPRLVAATEALRTEGAAFVHYEFNKFDQAPMYWIHSLWFKCTRCGRDLVINSIEEAVKEPPDLACPFCGHRKLKKKIVKEFLVSICHVNLSAWHMAHQWNIFSPLRLNPDNYPIWLARWERDRQE